jgi:hypothetical protein
MNMPDATPAWESEGIVEDDSAMKIGGEAVELVGLEADVWAHAATTRGVLYVSREEVERREDTSDPVESMIRWTADRLVYEMVDDLPIRTQYILEERAGLDDDPKTLEELGELFGVTRERIRQLENKALDKFEEDGSLQLLAYLTGRSEEEPVPLPEPEPEEPEGFILEPNHLYADVVAAWREELWARQERGERVHVRGSLLRKPPFPIWPYAD